MTPSTKGSCPSASRTRKDGRSADASRRSMPSARRRGAVLCRIPSLPLRPGIYFPVISILASDGRVRDRWRMERAIVIEVNGKPLVSGDLGSMEVPAVWSRV